MKKFMNKAIQSALEGIRKMDGGPFGACLVKNGKVLAVAHNTVLKNQDPTCHAEVNAIRLASRKLKNFNLKGCVMFTTTEPCPMCFAALHWACVDQVVFGARIQDVARRGFNELTLSSAKMKKLGQSPVKIKAGFMKKECGALLKSWDQLAGKKVY